MKFLGICCDKCLKDYCDGKIPKNKMGLMKYIQKVLKDGTVVSWFECNTCGHIDRKQYTKPERSIRKTGVMKCNNCGYEYFYPQIINDNCLFGLGTIPPNEFPDTEEKQNAFFEQRRLSCLCPECGAWSMTEIIEEYGELKHRHGRFGLHPITRKHRKGV